MSGLDQMKKRLEFRGGDGERRAIFTKLDSFHYALKDPYQSECITFNGKQHRCLINPDRLTNDENQRTLSIDFDCKVCEGSIIYWDRTKTYWIAYSQYIEEKAYFRSKLLKCGNVIELDNFTVPCYVRGPQNLDIAEKSGHNIYFNDLSYELLMYIPRTEDTINYFSRFNKVKFDGHNWKVLGKNQYSETGLLIVALKEDFDNSMEDKMRKLQVIDFNGETSAYIDGPQIVHPYDTGLLYTIQNTLDGTFSVDNKKIKIVTKDEHSCVIDVLASKSGEFNIIYSKEGQEIKLHVTIDSL